MGLASALPQQKTAQLAKPNADAAELFEAKVRPVLVANCFSCHGEKQQSGNLRLDSLAAALKGNAAGPAIVPGHPEKSPVVQVIGYDGKTKMPPTGKLKPEEIAAITEWIRNGAVWPGVSASNAAKLAAKTGEYTISDEQRKFWSFQPVRKPKLPAVKNRAWIANPVDTFILAKLEANGLKPAASADRPTLIRRAYYDLIGLPPTAEQIRAFVADKSPDAFAKVVDSLLASKQYGERWGRLWLDVARYADTRGYNFVDGRTYENAYTYRDYVIRAFNEDLPYNRFIIEQLAADQLDLGDDRRPLAAMGYLTVGRRFLNNIHDIIDDRIDVTTRGLMGLTVTCARCHDHKFDPIPTKDYYSLYGVFASSIEPNPPPSISPKDVREPWEKYNEQVKEANADLDRIVQTQIRVLRGRVNEKPSDVTFGAKMALQNIRIGAKPTPDQLAKLEKEFTPEGMAGLKQARDRMAALAANKPKQTVEFAMAMNDAQTPTNPHVLLRGNPSNMGAEVPRQFLGILCAPDSELGTRNLTLPQRKPFTKGSGRLELAQAIASPDNPLTARVFVNRIWRHHFGQAIVRTPSDFGTRSERPTHPELLDWLAAEFMSPTTQRPDDPTTQGAWSVKKLHRLIMLSHTYQQSCDVDPKAALSDAENRLISHMNRRRLDLEQMRDSVLWVAGTLDTKMGGPSVEIATRAYKPRRTVYGFIDRQNLPGLFRTFDLASPDSSSPQRFTTTVPQQALFMMNSPFVEDQVKALSRRKEFEACQSDDDRIRTAYTLVFGRSPSTVEIAAGQEYLKAPAGRVVTAALQTKAPEFSTWERYLQTLLMTNEFCFVD